MRLSILFFALALGPTACTTPCHAPADDTDRAELCETHPFGRAPYCGVEEPQTFQTCLTVLRMNAGICTSDYVACRDALRKAPCDVCPAVCDGVAGAC